MKLSKQIDDVFIQYIKSLDLSKFQVLEYCDGDEMEILSITHISDVMIARLTLLRGLTITIDILGVDDDSFTSLKKYDNHTIDSATQVLHEFLQFCEKARF